MAAVTVSSNGESALHGRVLRFYGTGAADTIASLTTPVVPVGSVYRLAYAYAAYSDTPVQAGVTVGIDSSIGATYDDTFTTGSANAKFTTYVPTDESFYLLPGDAVVVTAPAAGGVITCALVVVIKVD